MGGWLALIPWRMKVAAVVAAAFVLGLLRWRSVAVEKALEKARQEQETYRLNAVMDAQKVKADVEILDDVGLAARASKWVRKD